MIAAASACSWSIAAPPISTCRASRPSTAAALPKSACATYAASCSARKARASPRLRLAATAPSARSALRRHLTLGLSAGDAGVSRLASGAKSKIGYAGRYIADQAVQLHGGMGMTDELNVGHYFKRISSINIQFGDPAYHLLRYAQLDAAA